MNYKILFPFLAFFFLQCRSQKINDVNFKYGKLFYQDSTIIESHLYNSVTGLYEYKKKNFGFGEDESVTATIKLTEKELNDIYNLYVSLKPKHLTECIFNDNKLFYKSYVIFNSEKNKLSPECTTGKQEENNKIKIKILKLIKSSPAYKTAFYWEFIRK
ncbi:hypothetical protein ACM46_01390 [Chryseobacterium angstadtii]|uniref:Uncharacterized protein n=1 Tax=Chryseobacterium angstadtii TaxID=558151 RepID=A0A0J7LBA2_9FLAO|nr:hypothetical protein [Chryseobacterium angstadtii]KMQ66235.1 hypothetical protein ACM46_01390 [Chryseobacterium angstadtii]